MTGPRAPMLALAAALLAALSGCAHTAKLGRNRTVYIGVSEYRFTPQSVLIGAGPVTIFVHNYGRLTHDLVVASGGQPAASTRPIAPGRSAELALTLTPGSYQLVSTILSDQTLGVYGTLKVTS